jgi:hypothetical protein
MSIISSPGFKNVCILSISSALGGSIITLLVLAGSLVGTKLAPSTSWATAPYCYHDSGHRGYSDPSDLNVCRYWEEKIHCYYS